MSDKPEWARWKAGDVLGLAGQETTVIFAGSSGGERYITASNFGYYGIATQHVYELGWRRIRGEPDPAPIKVTFRWA